MAEKQSGKSTRRSQLGRRASWLENWGRVVLAEVTWRRALVGFGLTLAIALLLPGFQFRAIPDYKVGDIADRTLEAPDDFTFQDTEATERKREDAVKTVPAVFDLDLRRNSRIEAELRSGFAEGRRILGESRKKLGLPPVTPFPSGERGKILQELARALPTFNRGGVLDTLFNHGFSMELEEQMVRVLMNSMKHPGVAASRDMLLIYQDRGIVLYNTLTKQDEPLQDWLSVRDLEQARDLLRQNQYELTAVGGEEKKRIIEFLDKWVVPNVHFNEAETRNREDLAMNEVAPVLIQIKKGKTIVRAGDEVAAQDVLELDALRQLKRAQQPADRFVGIFFLVLFFMVALWQYFLFYESKSNPRYASVYLLTSLVMIANLIAAKLVFGLSDLVSASLTLEALHDPRNLYFAAPLALSAILIVLLVDAQMAIVSVLTFSVFVALMTGQISIVVYSLVSGLTAVYAFRQYRERSAILRVGVTVGAINVFTVASLMVYFSGFDWTTLAIQSASACVSGLFACMLASLALPVLESLFDITTDIRLIELSNLNKPILRRLAVEAPGTYHHSIIVGTLAEAAAEAIGANTLLVRVGAYYHDIGKLRKPEYYVENQIYMANKHEGLSPTMSSLILASHVKDGLVMAEEINLAPKVRDLIPQHHGTKLMAYFYQKAKQGSGDGKQVEVNEQDFRYPGPKPQSREAAILMLADQVEAASRTLHDPTPGQVRSLIRRLIQSTIQDRQFDECDITTKDLDQITRAFERVITGMYHHRVEYPGFDFNRQVAESQPENQRIQ